MTNKLLIVLAFIFCQRKRSFLLYTLFTKLFNIIIVESLVILSLHS